MTILWKSAMIISELDLVMDEDEGICNRKWDSGAFVLSQSWERDKVLYARILRKEEHDQRRYRSPGLSVRELCLDSKVEKKRE